MLSCVVCVPCVVCGVPRVVCDVRPEETDIQTDGVWYVCDVCVVDGWSAECSVCVV